LESDEAMLKLAILYELEEDFENARIYYEKAAAFENPDSLYRLGLFYKEAKGVEQDLSKTIAYFKEAKELFEQEEESEESANMLILLSEELEVLLKNHVEEFDE
jgi:TPR repeat protein